MNSQIIIPLAVAALVVVLLIGLVFVLRAGRRKKAESDRLEAAEMRSKAVSSTDGLQRAEKKAREADHVAEGRRLEAENAQTVAADAHRDLAVEQAHVEDQVRVADRVDPDVNHRAKGYAPQSPMTTRSHSEDPREPLEERAPSSGNGSHRAETAGESGEATTAAQSTVENESSQPGAVPAQQQAAPPEGSVANDDGTLTYPDGSVRYADGSTVDPGT